MKRRIGTIKGKPIIEGGGVNTLTDNEILVENNKIIYRENGELKQLGNSGSSDSDGGGDSTIDLDTIITGFYLGTQEFDSSYSFQTYTPNVDISKYIHKESNGIYTTDYQTLYNLKGSNDYLIVTTNIDNCCFVQSWTESSPAAQGEGWYLIPKDQNQQYDAIVDTILPAIIILH